MQGRLSPRPPHRLQAFPWDTWQGEFATARAAGFDAIEWIFEQERAFENPIWSASGRESIRRCVHETGVAVRSVCADYVMVHRLAGDGRATTDHAVGVLCELVEHASSIGAGRILVPLLETSAIDTPQLEDEAVAALERVRPHAERHGVVLGLEMEVPGERYAAVIGRLASRQVRAYYDTGNSAAKGLAIESDVLPLLPVLEAVHVKDRELGGSSCALGRGAAHFPSFFQTLCRHGWSGDLVLQSWFGADWHRDALRNKNFVELQLARAKREAA